MEISNVKPGDEVFVPNHVHGRVDRKRVKIVFQHARGVYFDDGSQAIVEDIYDDETAALTKVIENIDYWQDITDQRRDECVKRLSQIRATKLLDAACV